jgi:hypothetical protein
MKRAGVAAAIAVAGGTIAAGAQGASQRVEIVRVTGCLKQSAADSWTLTSATDPVVITRADPVQPPPGPPAATGGTNQFKLIGVEEFDLPARKDRLVAVKGLLIKATPVNRLNITSVTTVAESCAAAKK